MGNGDFFDEQAFLSGFQTPQLQVGQTSLATMPGTATVPSPGGAFGLPGGVPTDLGINPDIMSGNFTDAAMQNVRQQQAAAAQQSLIQAAQQRSNVMNLGISAILAGTQLAAATMKPQAKKDIEAETQQMIEARAEGVAATDPAVAALIDRAGKAAERAVDDQARASEAMLAGMGDTSVGAQQRVLQSGMQEKARVKTETGLAKAQTELQAAAARDERIYQGLAGEIQDLENVFNAVSRSVGQLAVQTGRILGEKPLEVPNADELRSLGYSDDQIVDIVRMGRMNNFRQNNMYASYLYAGQFGPTTLG
mgnify:CR=1 FL=1